MKSNFVKAFILGMGITFLSSGIAFAGTEEILPVTGEAQDAVLLKGEGSSPGEVGPTEPVLYDKGMDTTAVYKVNEEVLKRQSEIDIYIFKENYEELKAKGIFVTHTAPLDNAVEIGITPYTDENAEYLYSVLGKDMVSIIDGEMVKLVAVTEPGTEPEIQTMTAGAPDEMTTTDVKILNAPPADGTVSDADLAATTGMAEVKTLSAAEESAEKENTLPMPIVYSLGALVLLGSAAMVMKRKAATVQK